jgi:hypothetical protein
VNKNTKTSAQIRKNCCSSCQNTVDKSVYWMPTLFHVSNKGKRTPLVPSNLRFVYDHIDNKTSPIPENYKMICGSSLSRSPRDPKAVRAKVSWYCTDGPSALPGKKHNKRTFPQVRCEGNQGLAADVYCKTCVKSISPTKFRSAYANKKGNCPKGYFKIPNIWLSSRYDVSQIHNWGKNGSAPLWLASGDAWTMHFDFINGWSKKHALEMVKHYDPMGEFHLGGSEIHPNNPQCEVADPYQEKIKYSKYIITKGQKRLPGFKSWDHKHSDHHK